MTKVTLVVRGLRYGVFLLIGLSTAGFADTSDRYRYVLEESKNDKVCGHMLDVYNKNFATPWKQPMLDLKGINYGPDSPYSFPKLPGVKHDDRMAFDMSFSRLPTSPEFEGIEWREGRFRHVYAGTDRGDRPMLVAEFDINNDGAKEIVIKQAFMMNYFPSETGKVAGGEDRFFVFESGTVDLNKPITFSEFYDGQSGHKRPALISPSENAPYRLIRPFILNGMTYLSGYQQRWSKNFDPQRVREYIDIVRYRGGSENFGPGKVGQERWGPLKVDRICRFQMHVVKQR